MKISFDWLKSFIPLEGGIQEVVEQLTMLGLEAELDLDTSRLGDIIVGEVTSKIKHPNADRLSLCEVFNGEKTYPVVCGAPNVDKGQKVAFAPVGTVLPGDFKIGKAKIRGEVSQGMICSERELKISDEHEGIMVLNDAAEPGQSFLTYIDAHFDRIELDITPNRPDCFSHLGVARDLAIQSESALKMPDYSPRKFKSNEAESLISLSFEDENDCPRYIAGVVKNVKVGDSPDWLKTRLESVGQRSINNIVDISNFVLMEMGHPTHMFDYNQLGSQEILIRRGKKGEKITTLDESERKLSPNELLITNGKEPLAIAGIMGGLDSAVTDQTTTVLIESAYFDPPTVRKGSKALGMSTDASKRFERGADPNGAEKAFWRTISLLEEVADGEWIPGIVDPYPKRITQDEINLTREKLDILSGCDITDDFVVRALTGIGCVVNGQSNSWKCTPPSWRPDIEREVDLIEEVIRLYGYDNVPSKFHYEGIMSGDQPDPQKGLSKIISILSGFGFTQVFNNSLQSEEKVSILDFESVKMMNPLSDTVSQLRTSLFTGLMENVDFNIKNGHPDLMLFEWGNVFEQTKPGLEGVREKFQLSGIIYGRFSKASVHRRYDRSADFYVLKGVIEGLMTRLNVNNYSSAAVDDNPYGLSNASEILIGNDNIGYMGRVSPQFAKTIQSDVGPCYGFQFDLNALIEIAHEEPKYRSIVNYPVVERDLNFVMDESTPLGDVMDTIQKNGKNILIQSEPINIFRHESVGEGKKAIAINLVFQSTSKTLEDKDVNSVIDGIIKVVSNEFSAKLR